MLVTDFRKILPLVMIVLLLAALPVAAVTSGDIKARFASPSRHYSSGPLWVWNDMLTEQQIRSTLNDMASQKVKQVWVHPRPGLMTPYLSGDWFRLWNVALDEAKKLDMNVWIYDENSYPSGFAGGLVCEAMPESRGRGLAIDQVEQAPKADADFIAVYSLTDDSFENITDQVRDGKELPKGKYLVATMRRAGTSGWYGGKFYVDLIYPGVTEKFLDITLDAYRENVGDQFGKRIPGSFTDEPQLRPAGGLPWTDDLPQVFEKKWGYSLLDHLPSLNRPIGDYKRVRHNYFQTLSELFIDRWARPYHDFCEENGLEFTGHYWEHEWPNCIGVPDNLAMYAWHQRPAIDTLMNQYREDTHAQFGNARAVRELASVANQMGRSRTLCEAYGAGGWDLRFEDMKRIGDWLYVLGVNTLNEHLSYITIRGARKRDHPQSFSYHTPWWDSYHVMAEYFTRLSLVMSSGRQINNILLIEPTTTAWMYQADRASAGSLNKVGESFQNVVLDLERNQIEYDITSEDIMARHGSAEPSLLAVGKCTYNTVVIAPATENLNNSTVQLLKAYLDKGGQVICCGPTPALVDGKESNRVITLAESAGWVQVEPGQLVERLQQSSPRGFRITRKADDKGILFHHRRRVADGDFLLLVNTSITDSSAGTIRARAKGIQQWCPQTGSVGPYSFTENGQMVRTGFDIPPCGSLLLFVCRTEQFEPAVETAKTVSVVPPVAAIETRRLQPNVMPLDFVDIIAGGETLKDAYFYKANRFAFQKNGMERNPWDSAVQFKDELITRTFPADSGFEATYSFSIKDRVPEDLQIVIERPDLYSITCNGKQVKAVEGKWYLDKAFGCIDLESEAVVGENSVTIKASPFTIYHELEPAYLIGDFSLEATDRGFVVLAGGGLKVGPSWKKQGHPFYAAGVAYRRKFDIKSKAGRYCVEVPQWYGSVIEVKVNGESAGHIAYRPWRLDVTDAIQEGENTVEVIVTGTLKNTLGPHHVGDTRGAAWPNMFQRGPETGPPAGEDYNTLDYGLYDEFKLQNIVSSAK